MRYTSWQTLLKLLGKKRQNVHVFPGQLKFLKNSCLARPCLKAVLTISTKLITMQAGKYFTFSNAYFSFIVLLLVCRYHCSLAFRFLSQSSCADSGVFMHRSWKCYLIIWSGTFLGFKYHVFEDLYQILSKLSDT